MDDTDEAISQCHSFKMWLSVHVTAVSSVRGLLHIIHSPLQMETVIKILIKMRPFQLMGPFFKAEHIGFSSTSRRNTLRT